VFCRLLFVLFLFCHCTVSLSSLYGSCLLIWHRQEKIEDTKEVVRSRKSKKDRQHNGQRKTIERTNNDVESITEKTKDLTKPLKTGSELMCSWGVDSSCATCDTRRFILVTERTGLWLQQAEHINDNLWHRYSVMVNKVMCNSLQRRIYGKLTSI